MNSGRSSKKDVIAQMAYLFVRFKNFAPRAKKPVRSTCSKSIEETGYESHQHQV